MSDLDFEVTSTNEAEQSISGGGSGRKSDYEPIAQKYSEIDKDSEAIKLSGLTNNDVQNIRNLLYRRFGKENVIVRSSKVAEEPEELYDAVVRKREGGEYLRNHDSGSDVEPETQATNEEEESEPDSELTEEDEELEGVFE